MIFLTVGTWRSGYDRLIKAIDELKGKNLIEAEIFAQIGNSSYLPQNFENHIKFCSPNEFIDIVQKADLILTHAGIGSIMTSIQHGKKVVVLPRKPELGEHEDEHQFNTAEKLEEENLILVAYNTDQLLEKIREADDFIPANRTDNIKILKVVDDYIKNISLVHTQEKYRKYKLWPYHILERSDSDIIEDMKNIISYFQYMKSIDSVIFIPNAGIYLAELFKQEYGSKYPIDFVTVRRESTISEPNIIKEIILSSTLLSNIFRHIEVFIRRTKLLLRISQKMVKQQSINFDVSGKNVLVIDDSVDTGTTLKIVKKMLVDKGAKCVKTSCISNHLMPDKITVDYSVYRYALLRTKNSRDYKPKY
jgi:UDP-N-acetylglucosamine transferase subunit ALG13